MKKRILSVLLVIALAAASYFAFVSAGSSEASDGVAVAGGGAPVQISK